LEWDQTALKHALKIDDESIKETLPSLYLNIGKCYEDLNDFDNAKSNYQAAFSFATFLPDNGYGNMIKKGIINGLQRTDQKLLLTLHHENDNNEPLTRVSDRGARP